MTTLFLILVAVVVLLCIGLNKLSSRVGVPTLLAFMLLGVLFGNNDIWPVRFDNYIFAKESCTVALIFIMFYGGFGTRWEAVRPVVREAGLLASVGVVITAGLTGVFCHYAMQWGWGESLLLGAVVSSTDAASVFSILRSKRLGLKNNTAPMLEVESGSNDPFAYMLTALMLSIMNGTASGGKIAWMVFAQIALGVGCGIGIAKWSAWLYRKLRLTSDGFNSMFIFAIALIAYAVPDMVGGNGYLSVYLVGVMLGNEDIRGKRSLVGFLDGVTSLMQVLIFFQLGLLARLAALHTAILPAVAIFVFLLLVARPSAVFAILAPFGKYSFRQQGFISFVGLRGASSIVFAIMAMVDPAFLDHDFFNIVFCLVLISMSLQGSLIPRVARNLGMVDHTADVMKTFNDYSEDADTQFGQVEITEDCPWIGHPVKDLKLPHNLRIVLILRGDDRIIPRGETLIRENDKVITLTRPFDNADIFLYEKKVKPGSRRIGRAIREAPGDGLIVLVRRGERNIIPNGKTVLAEGDLLVILNEKRQ